ncbi:hypothetical protein [Plantactinospora mayteni]|nr:hypothetical protein [Plantactinospora mayteni]
MVEHTGEYKILLVEPARTINTSTVGGPMTWAAGTFDGAADRVTPEPAG